MNKKILLATFLASTLAAPAVAQTGASGSEGHVAPARELAAAAGAAQSESIRAATALSPLRAA